MGIQLASPESVIPESGPIIDIQNVTYTYWNRKKPTLNDVSIQIPRGKLTVIVGPGDSGKSTLCNLFNGVIPHLLEGQLKGNVFVNGVNTRSMPVGKHSRIVGRVFQDADSMFATLFVDDEIAFGPENFCFEPETIRKEVDRLIKEVDLLEHCHNLVWQLSGGQIQKLALACVLAVQPAVVVLDEPTANLDPDTTRKVNRMVLEMRNQGTTVVLISRELDEYLAHADQLVILNQGRVAAAGMPKNVLGDHGDFLINELGVWLPETSDVAIRLNRSGALHKKIDIPISVNDTVNAIKQIVVKEATRSHFTEPAVVKTEAECPKGEVVISARDLHYR